jgi:hypothetical protein
MDEKLKKLLPPVEELKKLLWYNRDTKSMSL